MRARLSALPAPVRVGAVVVAVHLAWVGAFFAGGHEIRDLIRIGPYYVTREVPIKSDVITYDPSYRYPANFDPGRKGDGYDGQFSYYLAIDPRHAKFYMDVPTYRYKRPLYAMTARALALGNPKGVEWTLLIVNILAMFALTAAMAAWLTRQGVSPWWGLAFGLTPGLLVSTQRDLTEPLGYALLAGALLATQALPRRWGWLAAGVLFGLAGLARQTTLLFGPFLVLALLLEGTGPPRERIRRNAGRALGLGALALVPYLAWSAWVDAHMHDVFGASDQFTAIPFAGFFNRAFELQRSGVTLLTVAVPATILLVLAIALIRRRTALWAALALAASACAFVIFNVDSNAYPARGRAAVGVAFAAVVCLPWLLQLGPAAKRALLVAAALWFVMLPVIAIYGLSLKAA
jgi:hypothetical protein